MFEVAEVAVAELVAHTGEERTTYRLFLADQARGDVQAPPHPAGEGPHLPPRSVGQPERFQQLVGAGDDVVAAREQLWRDTRIAAEQDRRTGYDPAAADALGRKRRQRVRASA